MDAMAAATGYTSMDEHRQAREEVPFGLFGLVWLQLPLSRK